MTFTITLGNQPALDAEERKRRAIRASEVLGGAGWAFDEFISTMAQELLGTAPHEAQKREQLYHQIDAAAQLKGHLMRIVEIQAAEEVARERRERKPADE